MKVGIKKPSDGENRTNKQWILTETKEFTVLSQYQVDWQPMDRCTDRQHLATYC